MASKDKEIMDMPDEKDALNLRSFVCENVCKIIVLNSGTIVDSRREAAGQKYTSQAKQ